MSDGRPPPTSSPSVLSALAGVARREATGEAPPGADARGRARVLEGFRARPRRPRRAIVWIAAAATFVAATLALVLSSRAPLRFSVDGAAAAAGVYVHAPAAGAHAGVGPSLSPSSTGVWGRSSALRFALPPSSTGVWGRSSALRFALPPSSTVRFSDGSEVAFAAGAGGRVVEVGPRGARILLETGTASFAIVHAPGARWSVEAGPFVIAVVGTAFDAVWSAETQTFALRLREGEVAVVGPLAPAGVHVHAGQQLTARIAEGELRIGELVTPAPSSEMEPPPPAPPAADVAVSPPPPAVAAPPPSAAPPTVAAPGWPKRVAAGDFRGVTADAEARGVDAVLRGVSVTDLAALADAARYAGRPDLARRALLAERARFAGSAEARGAAFLLGRLADDGGSTGAAVRWYDDYLTEAPEGAFAAEALGRKLVALRRAGDPAARATAAEYLRRYPEGPHAATARELASDP